MTTVCLKDGIMASDSCIIGVFIDQHEAKKIHVIGNNIIGVAGSSVEIYKFLKFFKKKKKKKPECVSVEGSFEAIVYNSETKKVLYYDDSFIPVETAALTAIGSGQAYAMGAMLNGASAYDAVLISSKLDPYTDDTVRVVNTTNKPAYRGWSDKDISKKDLDDLEEAESIIALEKLIEMTKETFGKPNKKKKSS